MTSFNTLKTHLDDNGILSITLHRPERLNALSAELLQELKACLLTAKIETQVKGLLITGAGEKAFCAGADIKQLATLNAQAGVAFALEGQAVFSLLENIGKPSIAAIHGYAFGGGCELAMAASLRIASDKAQFGQPEIKLGVIPGYGGTQRLSRLVGKGRALDLCLSGRTLNAQDALSWGLISAVTPADELLSTATDRLVSLLEQAPLALRYMLEVIHHGDDLPLAEALNLEATYFGLCCATQDKNEGVNAFLEKRKAHFQGK